MCCEPRSGVKLKLELKRTVTNYYYTYAQAATGNSTSTTYSTSYVRIRAYAHWHNGLQRRQVINLKGIELSSQIVPRVLPCQWVPSHKQTIIAVDVVAWALVSRIIHHCTVTQTYFEASSIY